MIKKEMKILYKVHNNLYVNLTNRCSSSCTFCLRQTMSNVTHDKEDYSLWLDHEPSFDEVLEAFKEFDMNEFNEVVFCGFGEPTERLDMVLQVAAYVKKEFGLKTRINTNGQSDLINKRNTAPEFKGLIDTVSISLNNPDPVKYQEIVRSIFGVEAFDAMLTFARNVRPFVENVVMTTVDTTITKAEEAECAEICKSVGAVYRIRAYES